MRCNNKKASILQEQLQLTKVIKELKEAIALIKEKLNQQMVEELQLKFYEVETKTQARPIKVEKTTNATSNLKEKLDLSIQMCQQNNLRMEEEEDESE